MLKSSLIFDEFPTIYFNNMDSLIATARSNQVATTLAMQDFNQLRKDYGKEKADVIINIAGNIISGQVMGETSKLLSERFGKIMQDRQSVSINRTDTSINRSKQLDSAIPASKIATLSSGKFVGLVANNPDEKIILIMFHAEILNDAGKLKAEENRFNEITFGGIFIPKENSLLNQSLTKRFLIQTPSSHLSPTITPSSFARPPLVTPGYIYKNPLHFCVR